MTKKRILKLHIKIFQRSPEWYELRSGRFTASNAQAIAAQGKGLDTLIYSLAAETLSKTFEKPEITEDMQRGIDLEKDARNLFEIETGIGVKEIGFAEYGKYAGCSPDGLTNDDGVLEIKCPNGKNYAKLLFDEEISSEYIWQMQMQMLILGKKHCYFCAHNPNFEQSLFVKKVFIDKDAFDKILAGLDFGEKRLMEILNKIKGS